MVCRGLAVLLCLFILGGEVMGADTTPNEKVEELKKQLEVLQQQLALANTQLALQTAKQTQEAQLAKAIAEALKNQATAQFNLEAEQAKLPLAELAGVKAALGGMQLPTGKSGTITTAAGTSGTALLRSKGPMLRLLDAVAKELDKQLPSGAVIITETQLDQAYQATFTIERLDTQTKALENAIKAARPPTPVVQPMFVPQFAAAAYSLGFVLDTVNNLAKLFRVDRKADIFAADAEALQMLGYMLEGKNPKKFVANPTMIREEVLTIAGELLKKLDKLLNEIHSGDDVLTQLKKIEEEEAKTKPPVSKLPAANVVTELKAQIEAARSFLDGLHPSKKPDAFWAQVKGQLISGILKDRDRLLLEAKGQAIQITESRWWRSDRISIGGEVQVAYRVLDKNGNVTKTGVILKASKAEETCFNQMPGFSFPPGESTESQTPIETTQK